MELSALVILLSVIILFLSFTIKKKPKQIFGKVALVTGGGNGLGREICLELAKHGCKIAIADVDYEGAKKTAAMLENVKSKAYKVDLLQKNEIRELKEKVLKDFGTVDILVNNAGLISYNTIFNESEEFIEKMTRVNLVAVILMVKTFMGLMIEKKSGHIVTVSSLAGIYHHAYGVTYSATKFGVTGFMMGLQEYIRRRGLDKNICCTIVMPDVISTREDVINAVSKTYNILTTEETAKTIVDGVLRNEVEVSVPKYFNIYIRMFQILPMWSQNIIRDKFMKESERFIVKGFDEI